MCDQLCQKYNLQYVRTIIKDVDVDKYTTIASIHELDNKMKASLKTIAESNGTNPENLLPDILKISLLDYIAIGKIAYGAMALHKLGYKVDPMNKPERTRNGNMFIKFYSPSGTYTYTIWECDDYVALWYELEEIQSNIKML